MINRYSRWIFPLEKMGVRYDMGYVNASPPRLLIVENISNAFVVTHRQLSHLRETWTQFVLLIPSLRR